uniref:helix-turn-helix domain-containing protein n=1 Tax=Proteiniclasticum ruminis TaxID=398199 RepID=UPI0028A7CF55
MAQTDSNTSKNKFKHLLFHQRTLIEFMVKNGYKPADIARELGVNPTFPKSITMVELFPKKGI